jgi:hypothetical protein
MTETLLLTIPELNHKLIAAADAVRTSVEIYREANAEAVEAERDYLHARAVARPRLKSKLVADREDEMFLMIENEWLRFESTKVLVATAKEALRASEAILSGLQSVAAAHRADAQLARWGPEEIPA